MTKIYEALQRAHRERQDGHPNDPSPSEEQRPDPQPQSHHSDPSLESEMVQLQQRLTALLPDPHTNMIQFISSRNGEGTSTLTRALANVVAKHSNKSVLLVETTAPHLDQHRAFHLRPKSPLASLLTKGGAFHEALSPVPNSSISLCQLFDESTRPDPGWLSPQQSIGEWIRKQFDLIVIDSPSLSTSLDGLSLCASVDGVILVVEAETTRAPLAQNLKHQVLEHGGHLLGIVFNKQRYYIPDWIYHRL